MTGQPKPLRELPEAGRNGIVTSRISLPQLDRLAGAEHDVARIALEAFRRKTAEDSIAAAVRFCEEITRGECDMDPAEVARTVIGYLTGRKPEGQDGGDPPPCEGAAP